MGEVVPARTSLILLPHPLTLCCHYPVLKYRSASIVVTSTLRVKIGSVISGVLLLFLFCFAFVCLFVGFVLFCFLLCYRVALYALLLC